MYQKCEKFVSHLRYCCVLKRKYCENRSTCDCNSTSCCGKVLTFDLSAAAATIRLLSTEYIAYVCLGYAICSAFMMMDFIGRPMSAFQL